MASKETWDKLRYFKADSTTDRWGEPNEIADVTLLRLDDFRHYVGVPIYVLRGVETQGHKSGSYHYPKESEPASAVDIILPDYQQTPFDLITEAARFGFTGIGYYPHWKWGGKRVGGLHLDCRELKLDSDGTLNYRHNRWMGVLDNTGKQTYIALTFHNLWKYTQEAYDVRSDRLP